MNDLQCEFEYSYDETINMSSIDIHNMHGLSLGMISVLIQTTNIIPNDKRCMTKTTLRYTRRSNKRRRDAHEIYIIYIYQSFVIEWHYHDLLS
jgi:hypothetical protein